jgi:beta-lactamase regulating signal transducer with metallopeptidase domain
MDTLEILINAVGWTLIHSIWLGALAAAAYAIPAARLRIQAPQSAYAWGLGCLLALVLALIATFAHELDHVRSHADAAAIAAAHAALPVAGSASDNAVTTAVAATPVVRLIEPLLPLLVLLWALAVIAIGGGLLRSQLALRRLITAGIGVPALAAPVVELARHFGVSRPIAVVSSAVARVPFVIGHFAPVIVLPLSVATGMPWPQLKLILAHEIAHLRRADYLVNWLQIALEVLLFFHPGVRWLSEELRRLREACCDDMVVAYAGGRADYTRALLSLEEFRHDAPLLAPSAVAGGLLWRVQRIAGRATNDRGALQKVMLPALFLGVLVSVIGGGLQIRPGAGPRDLSLPQAQLFAYSTPAAAPLQNQAWQARLPPLVDARATPASTPSLSATTAPAPALPTIDHDLNPLPPIASAVNAATAEVAPATLSPAIMLLPGAGELEPTYRVKPVFPRGARLFGQTLTVELGFQLDASGAVAGITALDAPAGAEAFIAAAQAALAQWRYPADAAAQLAGETLRHRFEFRDQGSASDEPEGCSMVTGSRICVVNGGAPERNDDVSPRSRRCDTTTGTRLCRR